MKKEVKGDEEKDEMRRRKWNNVKRQKKLKKKINER